MGAEIISFEEKIILRMIEHSYNTDIPIFIRNPNNFELSAPIARETVSRFLKHKDLIEESHSKMDGSEPFKIAGYLTYWIATLKPVLIFEQDPNEHEILANEYLAIAVAVNFIKEKTGISILSQKLVDDLKYSLRYRTLTQRMLPIVYEAYVTGLKEK